MYYATISEFFGIQQHKDGALLPSGTARDARNMNCIDGNLSTVRGKESDTTGWTGSPISGEIATIYRIDVIPVSPSNAKHGTMVAYTSSGIFVAPCEHELGEGEWEQLAYSGNIECPLSASIVEIGSEQCLLYGFENRQILMIVYNNGAYSSWEVRDYGSGTYCYEERISKYDSTAFTVTVQPAMMSEYQQRMALAYGLYIGPTLYKPTSVTSTTITFSEDFATSPVNQQVQVLGGLSNASVSYLQLYAGRLFAGNDAARGNRLYWSAVAGDGRTLEDWRIVDGSEDASGGYVEVGNDCDSITGLCALTSELLIFTQSSIWRLYGDRPSEFTIEKICPVQESIRHNSCLVYGGAAYWLSADGLMCYNGSYVSPVGDGTRYLLSFLDGINPSYEVPEGMQAFANHNRMYFPASLRKDDSVCLVEYDILRQTYMVHDFMEFVATCSSRDAVWGANGTLVYRLFNNKNPYIPNEYVESDPCNSYWKCQPNDMGTRYWKKQIKEIFMRVSGNPFLVRVECGDVSFETIVYPPEGNDGLVRVPIRTSPACVFTITFETIDGKPFEIHGGFDIGFEKEAMA